MDGLSEDLSGCNYDLNESSRGRLSTGREDQGISGKGFTPLHHLPQVLPVSGRSTRPPLPPPPTLRLDCGSGEASRWYSAPAYVPSVDEFQSVEYNGPELSRLTVPDDGLPISEDRWPTPRQCAGLPKPESSGFVCHKRKRVDLKLQGAPRADKARPLGDLRTDERLDLHPSPKKSKDGGSASSTGGAREREQDGEGLVPPRRRDPEEPVPPQNPEATTEASPGRLQFDMELGYGQDAHSDRTDGGWKELSSESSSAEGYEPTPIPNPTDPNPNDRERVEDMILLLFEFAETQGRNLTQGQLDFLREGTWNN